MDNNILYTILGVIGSLVGFLLIQTNKKNQLAAELKNKDTETKDLLLAKDQDSIKKDIDKTNDEIAKVEQERQDAIKAAETAALTDILKFWNKK